MQRCGFVSLLYSVGEKPLDLWSKHISLDGQIRRVRDEALNGDKVIEITGPRETSVPTNISCPSGATDTLNIKLPILVLVVKNLQLELKVEFQLLDKKTHRRKFSLTNYDCEKLPTIDINVARLSLKLEQDWNILEINLQSLCRDVYGTDHQALQRIIIYPNCRIRRIYMLDRHYENDETPVELCQAFFDIWGLKWGIHLVERGSQTEESYTGPLQPHDLEFFNVDSNVSIVESKTDSTPGSEVVTNETRNSDVIPSVDEFDNEIALKSDPKLTSTLGVKSSSVTNYAAHAPAMLDERKVKSANFPEKEKKRITGDHRGKKSKETGSRLVNVDATSAIENEKKHFLRSFPHIEKSQYLKMQIGENFFNEKPEEEGHIFQEWPYMYDAQHRDNGRNVANLKHCDTNETKRILENYVNLKYYDPNVVPKHECVAVSETEKVEKATNRTNPETNGSISESEETCQGDCVKSKSVKAIKDMIDEVQKIRDELSHRETVVARLAMASDGEVKETYHAVPSFVEMQATYSNTTSKETFLSTDKAIGDFLELRHVANKTIFEKLQNKGLTMTEVELSIYNSKNRRNCYGQGKLIDSRKSTTDKGSGLGSIKPIEMHASLKRERLHLNGSICTQLRNELDAALLQLKSTPVRVTPQMVSDTIGAIVKNVPQTSDTHFFTAQEAEFIAKKVYCTENMLKRDRDMDSCCKYSKNENNDTDPVNGVDGCSSEHIVDLLYQRRLTIGKENYYNI